MTKCICSQRRIYISTHARGCSAYRSPPVLEKRERKKSRRKVTRRGVSKRSQRPTRMGAYYDPYTCFRKKNHALDKILHQQKVRCCTVSSLKSIAMNNRCMLSVRSTLRAHKVYVPVFVGNIPCLEVKIPLHLPLFDAV